MGKTIVKVMMTGLEKLGQFVTGGRIFVCVVLALLFLPITLGVCTLLAVLLPIWYALHIHLAVGAVAVAVMAVLAYRNYDIPIGGCRFKYTKYSYEKVELLTPVDGRYELKATAKESWCDYCFLRMPYVFLLQLHVSFLTMLFARRNNLYGGEYTEPAFPDNEKLYLTLTGIAWSAPAYIALGLGVLMTIAYFVNTLIFGSADTIVSDIIHGPWLYLAGDFGG